MLNLEQETREILETQARDVLAAGWAELRVVEVEIGLTLHLEPIKQDAAPLEIYFDSDQLVVCAPGRHDMVCEFFSEDAAEIKRQVRALAAAVVAGTYAERVKDGTTEVAAEWPGPDGPQEATRTVLAVVGSDSRPWRSVTYEPY
ncbi:MAG TPA: hypothetical protein VN732_02870 [Solirubrobacterales bacterium]|nr:hypothetical protein [Solirubrobacterales bacterium]